MKRRTPIIEKQSEPKRDYSRFCYDHFRTQGEPIHLVWQRSGKFWYCPICDF